MICSYWKKKLFVVWVQFYSGLILVEDTGD